MSASSDYGVKVVESFAPPKNWIPGEEVNKDTYAVNTGSIPAYVRSDVSGVLSLTTEKPVQVAWGQDDSTQDDDAGKAIGLYNSSNTSGDPFTTGTNFDSFIKLDEDEVYSIEAGSYLAYKPAASQQSLGKQVVIYPSNAATTKTVYAANADNTTYGAKNFNNGDEITAEYKDTLSDGDKAKFPTVTKYKCVQTGTWGTKYYTKGDIIPASEYGALASTYQSTTYFTPSSYACTSDVSIAGKTANAGDTIEADVYNALSAADQAKFTATTVANEEVTYKAKEGIDTNNDSNNEYNAGDTLTASQYAALTDENKEKVAVVTVTPSKTDFTPDAEGLYVFRRTVVVNNNATEQFTYDGYYFKDGRYYKITDLEVIQDDSLDPKEKKDELDVAGDGNDKDGQLADAKAKFLVDDTTIYYEPETFTYDEANNRLVATYLTTTNNKYADYLSAAKALDEKEHTLAETRTALDRALNDAAASDAKIAFLTNRIAQLNSEIASVQARMNALAGEGGTSADPVSPSALATLNAEKNRLTTAQTAAKDAADAALKDMYGTHNTSDANATYDAANDAIAYNDGTNSTIPTTVAGSPTSGGKWKEYLTAKEALETARQSGNYGHDLFTAYVNELTKSTVYGSVFTTAGFTDLSKVTYEDVLNTLSYAQLIDTTKVNFDDIEQNAGGPLHNINTLTANLVKAKADFEEKETLYKNKVAEYKRLTNQIGDDGATATTSKTEIIGGASVTYDEKTVSGESGIKGDIARAKAEWDTLNSKLTALNAKKNAAIQDAVDAEKTTEGTDISDNLVAAYAAYQTASENYDKALNDYNAKKKAYENGNPLKIYINLSENVVTTATGLTDRWQLLPVNPLVSKYTKDGRVIGEDGVQDDVAVKYDTAVFYYTSILGAGETSSKLVDSVTLDAGTTQGMYKAFDYDLNVALKSAQIAYDADGNVTADATTELDAKAVLPASATTDSAVNWTLK